MSAYGFTLAALTQVDAEDLGSWLERARHDLRPAEVVERGETASVLRVATECYGRHAELVVYKDYGTVRVASNGADPRAFERYLCELLELTVESQIERRLPERASERLAENGRQDALMEMFRALDPRGVERAASSDGWAIDWPSASIDFGTDT